MQTHSHEELTLFAHLGFCNFLIVLYECAGNGDANAAGFQHGQLW